MSMLKTMQLAMPDEKSILRILGTLSWREILPTDLVTGDAK
jgi:hypothetical protein